MKYIYILKLFNNKGEIYQNGIFYFENKKAAKAKGEKLLGLFPQANFQIETALLKMS